LFYFQVSAERQAALTRLCSGRAAFSPRKTSTEGAASPGPSPGSGRDKITDAEVEGVRYKVVWSCMLLLEMVMDDVACAAHFQTLATNVVGKVTELLRLFNTRSTHLVLGAGAIHSAARLKSINAKHLAIVTQCIALVLAILSHIRAALMAQLPAKQHTLLFELDKIKSDYHEHCEKILNKLVSIIGGIVEHSLAPRIANTDYDKRAREVSLSSDDDQMAPVDCCPFLDNVVTNTKKMHQVLLLMLPTELLRDVFSRIFAYLDHKVPSLFKAAANSGQSFSMPSTDEGKLQMIKEVEYMARTLNGLLGVQPWNFTATKVLEQELDVSRAPPYPTSIRNVASKETPYAPEGENSGGTLTGDMADTSTTQDNALVDCAADTSNSQDDTSEQTSGAPQESDTLIISTDNLTAVEGSTIKEGIEIEGPTTDKVTPSQDDCGGGESADTPIG
jgi:vacuolar protein sorting-associated protein 54